MNIDELITTLTHIRNELEESNPDALDNVNVYIASTDGYRNSFVYRIVNEYAIDEDENDDTNVYISLGSQVGHTPASVIEELGW